MKSKNFKKLRNKCHLRNLLLVAICDGNLDPAEDAFLRKKAKELGFKAETLEKMLKNPKAPKIYFPEKIGSRITLLYDLICMMLADGLIHTSELEKCREIANKMNLLPSVVDAILKDIQRKQNQAKEPVFSIN